jgi:hypothetical protein
MPAFDHVLIDPPADDLVATLHEAASTANQRCRVGLLKGDDGAFRELAATFTRKAEGSNRWIAGAPNPDQYDPNQRATLVGAAWWSDPLGRKHARVVGRRLEPFNGLRTNRFGPLGGDWAPLGLVYPDAVVLRTLPRSQRKAVGLCACGTIGTLESVGWMGPCCAACHDRQEEGQAPPLAPREERGAVVWTNAMPGGVGFSAKGDLVWASMEGVIECAGEEDRLYVGGVGESLSFACDGKLAGLAGYAGIALWDADMGEKVAETDEVSSPVRMALAISPDGKQVAVTGEDGLQTWAVKGKQLTPSWGDNEESCALAFSPDGDILAAGTTKGWLVLLAASGDGLRPNSIDESMAVRAVAFSPQGNEVAAGTGSHPHGMTTQEEKGDVYWFDCAWRKARKANAEHSASVCSVAYSPDGKVLASGSNDRSVKLWDVASGKLLVTLEWHLGPVRCVAFSPDGVLLASASTDGAVRLWPWRRLLER